MGNRAVLVSKDTTKENANTKLGIYVHNHGDKEIIEEVLSEAKRLNVRDLNSDTSYFWARLCQIFANRITEDILKSPWGDKEDAYETGIGIDIVSNLDCCNGDNGVYYINENFEIKKHTSGKEF